MYLEADRSEHEAMIPKFVAAINEEDFRRWIGTFDDSDTVGLKLQGDNCPLAQYLGEQFTEYYIEVDAFEINIDSAYEPWGIKLETPVWAKEFICRVDTANFIADKVSAVDALKVLDTLQLPADPNLFDQGEVIEP